MRKRYLLFLVLPLFLSFCSDVRSDYSQIKIAEVVDGDTLLLDNGQYLRLIGIDTPEIRKKTSQGFVYDPAPFSLEAGGDGEVCLNRVVGVVQVLMPYTCGYEHAFSFANFDVRVGRIVRTLFIRRGDANAELAFKNIDDLIPLMGFEL